MDGRRTSDHPIRWCHRTDRVAVTQPDGSTTPAGLEGGESTAERR